MLQNLRSKLMGWRGVVIFGSLGLIMTVAFGVGNYAINNQATWVAKVDKHEISQDEYNEQMNDLRQRLNQSDSAKYDSDYFKRPEVKQQVLDTLIDRYLMKKMSKDLGMVVTDADVRREIATTSYFQSDGKFDADKYRQVLANAGMSTGMFEARTRDDLETRLLANALFASGIYTGQEVDNYLALAQESRDIAYLALPVPTLEDKKVSAEDSKAYYDDHQDQFTVPEMVAVDYIELDADKLDLSDELSEEALKARYEVEKARFVAPEQKKVSHILIKVDDDADKEAQDKALETAQKVADQAQNGDDFAQLAEKYSDDAGSKHRGGSLGWLQSGIVGKNFDEALKGLSKGQVSNPVKGEGGYHIIKVVDSKKGKTKPFDEVRDTLVKEITDKEKAKKYSQLAGELTDLVYANPSSLEPAAEKLDVKIKHSQLFSREGTQKGIGSQPKVVQAAFSDNVLKDDNSSDPISLGDNHIVVLHLAKHEASKVRPHEEVMDEITDSILQDRLNNQAKKQADTWLAKLEKGTKLDAIAKELGTEVETEQEVTRNQAHMDNDFLAAIFKLGKPSKDHPSFTAVHLGTGKYTLLALENVKAGSGADVDDQQRRLLQNQLGQIYTNTVLEDWLKAVRDKAKITIASDRM